MLRRGNILAMVALCGACGMVRAGEVEIAVQSNEVFADVPFLVKIAVTAIESHEAPQFPQLDGATASLVNTGTSTQSSFQMTINGRQVAQRTTVNYSYHVTAKTPGTLKIPPIEVLVDGEKKFTRPLLLKVSKAQTQDLLFVDMTAEKSEVYVGESVDIVLRIWIQPYVQQNIRLDADDMWSLVDKAASTWGPFLELLKAPNPRVNWRPDTRTGDDGQPRAFIVYLMQRPLWAERPGPLLPENLRVVVNYPLRIGRENSIFGGMRITQSQTLVGTVSASPVTVKPIPADGRPPYFRGAVGPHTITASAAPTDAQVGDPITLTVDVRGASQLETLQAPPLAELAEFTTRFQVADDPLPGIVTDGQKRFTQSLRALAPDVTEIPPIPFAYFDPEKRAFQTVYSQPIPLTIRPAERMSATQIVHAGTPEERRVENLTHSVHGIESNYVDPAALLAQQGLRPSLTVAAVAGGCPVAYAALALLLRRRRTLESNVALRRRRGARRAALHALASADGRPEALTDALLGYVADRLDVPPGGLTRQEAVQRLRSASVAEGVVVEVDEVLADCEAAQFGGRGAFNLADLAPRMRDSLDALVRAGV